MSFDLMNCRKCGKLFQRTGIGLICQDCEKALEEKYQEVKEYLREHNAATVVEVSKEMDVSVEQIKKWVRQERLYFNDPESIGIDCLMCGRPISKGKYCSKCKEKVTNRLNSAYKKEKPASVQKDGDKMRFLDKDF